MANSIKDGIITYNGYKYKIVGETEEYYIGFLVKSLRSYLCRINKDLTGWKSKSINDVIDITKVIINQDGSMVAIGSMYEHFQYDIIHAPGSSCIYVKAIICAYNADLSMKQIGTDHPYIVFNHQNITDSYFNDIQQSNDQYVITGYGLSRKADNASIESTSLILIMNKDFTYKHRYLHHIHNHCDLVQFEGRSFAKRMIIKENIFIFSDLERIICGEDQFRQGLAISRLPQSNIGEYLNHVLFGSKLIDVTYDDEYFYILVESSITRNLSGDNASIIVHTKPVPKLIKINNDLVISDELILSEYYDKIYLSGDQVVVTFQYVSDDLQVEDQLLTLTKDLLLDGD